MRSAGRTDTELPLKDDPCSHRLTQQPLGDADAANPPTDLGQRSLRGGMVTLGTQGAKFLLHLASTVIMARLLIPEDFGLVAMVAPVIAFVGLFQDLGLSAATIQRQAITPAQSSTIFWINVCLATALAALVALLSPLVAWFYDEPRLVQITLALAALLVCSGLTSQHLALMKREMRFSRLAALELAALAVGVAVGIIGGLLGLGYWALVAQTGASAAGQLVLVWLFSHWRPGRPVRRSGVRPMLRFGSNVTLVSICYFLGRYVDGILIGKFWGEATLGFYNRAYGLLLMHSSQINVPVNNVAIPVLSRLQHDLDRYREYYLTGIALLATLSMPVVMFMTINAHDVVHLVLGEKWLPAVPIFLALAPAAFVTAFDGTTQWVYVTIGRTDRQLRWTALIQTPIKLAAYVAAVPFGATAVAVAHSCVTVGLRLPAMLYCYRGLPLRVRDVMWSLAPAASSSMAAGATLLLVEQMWTLENMDRAASLALKLALFSAFYLAIYCCQANGRRNLMLVFALASRGARRAWRDAPA